MTLNSKHRQKKEQLKNNDAETQKTKHRNKKKQVENTILFKPLS